MNKLLLLLTLFSTNAFALTVIASPECVKESANDYSCTYYRYSIPNGWIVFRGGYSSKSFFISDPDHRWK